MVGELDQASISKYFSTAAARLVSLVPSNDGFKAFATLIEEFVVIYK